MMWTEKYIGWQSRNHDPEVSCWDFVVFVMDCEFGIELPHYRPTTPERMKMIIHEEQISNWRSVPLAQSGDLAILRVKKNRYHIGIMVNGSVMIHHRSPYLGAVLDSLNSGLWRNTLEGFYRHASR